MPALPPNLIWRRLNGNTAVSPDFTPMEAAPITSGLAPYALENLTRTCEPPSVAQTESRTVVPAGYTTPAAPGSRFGPDHEASHASWPARAPCQGASEAATA